VALVALVAVVPVQAQTSQPWPEQRTRAAAVVVVVATTPR
jgi:hypothetical protein